MEKKRIMIVEDEPVAAEDIRNCLLKAGFLVPASVCTGEEAIEIILSVNPDLVLMDICLAGRLDGIGTAHWISRNADIPVIYLTAYSDEETIERAKATEPFAYVIKPFDRNELRAAVEMTLLKHAADRKKDRRIEELEDRNRLLQNEIEALSGCGISGVELGHGFCYDKTNGNLLFLDREVILTKKERLFIHLLAENIGKTVSFGKIAEYVRGRTGVDDNNFRIFLWRLRSKVGKELIRSNVGVGYRIENPRNIP